MNSFRDKSLIILFSALLTLPVSLIAQTSADQEKDMATIREVVASSMSNLSVDSITPSPIAGLYEITLDNAQVIYSSADARYFIPGDLFEVMPQGVVNRGEEKRNVVRAGKIAAVPESDMIIFEPEDGRKATITVFTDVDCPYCRQLHSEVERLNELGIAVRYLAFPRTGLNTETHEKMVSTWCADDPKAMLTSAKRGGTVPHAECDNPVAMEYMLGREVGVTGTPALVLEDGTILPGYVPADTLAEYLLGPASH